MTNKCTNSSSSHAAKREHGHVSTATSSTIDCWVINVNIDNWVIIVF